MKRMVWLGVLLAGVVFSGAATAQKPVLGVAEFKNQTSAAWWRGGVGWELSSMLSNELAGTEKFRVVERSKLETVLREQDLGASGRVRQGTAAQIGQLTGAQYLVLGTVSAYQERTQGGGGGISIGGFSIGGRSDDAYIAVDLRVVNATTGELDFTRTVEARSGGFGLNLGVYRGGFGGNLSQYENTPAGKAIRAVLMEISEYLACVMVEKGSCVDEYREKEQKRRDKTKSAIKLE